MQSKKNKKNNLRRYQISKDKDMKPTRQIRL